MIVGFLDLEVRLLELDEERRPADTRHGSTSPPAPAALARAELHAACVAALDIARVTRDLAASLLGAQPGEGQLGIWLDAPGGLERVIQLHDLTGVGEGRAGIQESLVTALPLDPDAPATGGAAKRHLAALLLQRILSHAQRRGFAGELWALAALPPPGH